MENENKSMDKKTIIGIASAAVAVIAIVVVLLVVMGGGSSAPIGVAHDYEKEGYVTIGQYSGLSIDLKVTDEQVKEEIDAALEEYETYEHQDGTVSDGLMINADLTCKLADGSVYEDLSIKDDYITVGEEDYFAEIDQALIGMNTGDENSVSVTIPEDVGYPDLEGQTVTFDIKVNYICGPAKPAELNDEFATEYSEGVCTNAAEFEDYIKQTLYTDNVENLAENIWDEVVSNCEVKKYHKGELRNAIEETNKSYESFAEASGYTKEELLETFGMTEDDIEEVAKDTAASKMIAKTIAAKEGLVLGDEDYKNLLVEYMEYENEDDKNKPLEEIEKDYLETYEMDPKDGMLQQYVMNYIVDLTTVTGRE